MSGTPPTLSARSTAAADAPELAGLQAVDLPARPSERNRAVPRDRLQSLPPGGSDRNAAGPFARIFGFAVSPLDAQAIASLVVSSERAGLGVGLVVTANIDHVRLLRSDTGFRLAYRSAEIVTCDGFPVHAYARLRGLGPPPGRVTGCDIAAALLRHPDLGRQRLFVVADSIDTVAGLQQWAKGRGLSDRLAFAVPPRGFEADPLGAAALARAIAAHATTVLVMGVGAPRSERFVHENRGSLGDCWALCVGQAVRIEAGLTRRAPALLGRLNLEWLWRLAQEPRRLARRYAVGGATFALAVADDLRGGYQGSGHQD